MWIKLRSAIVAGRTGNGREYNFAMDDEEEENKDDSMTDQDLVTNQGPICGYKRANEDCKCYKDTKV